MWRSTLQSTSIVSAVPDGEVMDLDEVFGMVSPAAAMMGMMRGVVRFPGTPPMQCLSRIIGFFFV